MKAKLNNIFDLSFDLEMFALVRFYLVVILCLLVSLNCFAGRYDTSINVFGPDGRLQQVEYAEVAAKKGSSLVALALKEELIILTKTQEHDQLLDRRILDKIQCIDDDIWIAVTGLAGDGKEVIRISRMICTNWREQFNAPPPVLAVANKLGNIQHEATIIGGTYGPMIISILSLSGLPVLILLF